MRQRGFSLIELLIVVMVILIIAAIAIPNMMKARMSANEASAVTSVHAVNTAQTTYAINYPDVGYADDLAKLGAPGSGNPTANRAALLDWVLGCGTQPCSKSGYKFQIVNTTGTPVASYGITAVPIVVGQTGRSGYCSQTASPVTSDPAGGTNCTVGMQ